MHKCGLIHRDIKPDNICLSSQEAEFKETSQIYLIDFGLAKAFENKDHVHIPFVEDKKVVGTANYVSFNTNMGYEQSRRDDMEVLGNTIIKLIKK